MPSISASDQVTISAAPDVVFAHITEFSHRAEAAANNQSIESLSDGPVGVGSEFKSTTRFMGRDIVANIKMTEFDPPNRFAFSVTDSTGEYNHEVTLSAEGNGTRVSHRLTGSMPFMMYLTYLMGGFLMGKSAAKKFNNNLKAGIESS